MFFFLFDLFSGLVGVIFSLLSMAAAVWAFFDARRRGLAAWTWAGIAFSVFPLGLLGYLAYRAMRGTRIR